MPKKYFRHFKRGRPRLILHRSARTPCVHLPDKGAKIHAHVLDFCGLNKLCACGREKHIFTDMCIVYIPIFSFTFLNSLKPPIREAWKLFYNVIHHIFFDVFSINVRSMVLDINLLFIQFINCHAYIAHFSA